MGPSLAKKALRTAVEIGIARGSHILVGAVIAPDGPSPRRLLSNMSRACTEFERRGLVATPVTQVGRCDIRSIVRVDLVLGA